MSSHSPQPPRLLTSSSYLSLPPSVSPSSSPEASPSPPSLAPPLLPSPSLSPRPSMSRAPSHKHTRSLSQTLSPASLPTSPFLSPQPSTANVHIFPRLLMPTVRPARPPSADPSPKVSSTKSSPSKIARSSYNSVTPNASPEPNNTSYAKYDWIGGGCRFEIVEDMIQLEGYQIYAVEKWIVERRRSVTVLTVFTGDPKHKVAVTALSPLSTLAPSEAQQEWDKAIHHLRRDGARPKETEGGTVMVTSLANFRSDFTIVHIPRGNFLDIREQLYTNINVLRMGCSGRSALTLEQPSDTTKDRLISMYHIPDKALARSSALFNPTVLELVKLIQAALAICGMFEISHDERNGLLCDVTWEGIQRWIAEIGEPCMEVEPMERAADPTVVAALFSMTLSIRNKLHAMGYNVPKDPFIDPITLVKALTAFQYPSKSHSHSLSLTYHSPMHATPVPSYVTLASASSMPSTPNVNNPPVIYLSQPIIEAIQAAYEKHKQSETYKVHRVLKNKWDGLATEIRTNSPDTQVNEGSSKRGGSWGDLFKNPTTDIDAFVKMVVLGAPKDGAPSLKYLWSGKPDEIGRKRREKEVLSEGEERGRVEKEREKGIETRERERIERERDGGVRSSEDEADYGNGRPWSGRVQRKLESWTALGRAKKISVDLGAKGRSFLNTDSPFRGPSPMIPSVVISRDPAEEDDILSSGQASPVSDSQILNPFLVGTSAFAERSARELSEYDRRVTEFNHRRPLTKPQYQSRIISWADPVTARAIIDYDDEGRVKRGIGVSPLGASAEGLEDTQSTLVDETEDDDGIRPSRLYALKKRRSFDDAERLRGTRILPIDRMRIDVELCGQLLIMYRREQHLVNVIACLQALTTTLSNANASIRNDYTESQPALAELERRMVVLQDIEAARVKADSMTQETNALAYESAQFLVDDLWDMASQPRRKVLTYREKVFGTGRRLRQGVHGAHGQFNRVQWTVEGSEVLVDALGRTESEAEEEEGLPGAHAILEAEDEAEVVDHQNLRPTWILRLFNYWGSRWASKNAEKDDGKTGNGAGDGDKGRQKAMTTSVETSTGTTLTVPGRATHLVRNNTA